ncbi:MAG: helix-turn-helix domain-containing protein [Bellilinea sp.]
MKKNTKLVAVGERIRSLRLEKGLTQEEFALLVGLDRSYFGGVERGERNISVLNLIKIAQALDKEIGDLFPPMSQLTKTR